MDKLKNKVGRPKSKIDREQLENLARLQCTYDEIASFFGVSKSTIHDNFRTEMDKGREFGKMSIRRHQFNLSKTSAAMAIWLGKNYLGQKEPVAEPLEVNIDLNKNTIELLTKLQKENII